MSGSSSSSGRKNPYVSYRFKVKLNGNTVGGFSEVSGLTAQRQTVEYAEGGVNNYVHQLPGQVSYSNLVLKRGLTADKTFWEWLQTTKNGMDSDSARKNVQVILQNSQGDQTWGWEFSNAYPIKWSGPPMQGRGGGVALETVEITHEGFTKISGMPK